jgi:hypothetical protein
MGNVSGQSCRENKKNTFYVKIFFLILNCAVYEIMWKNMGEPDRPQMSLYTACRITKATDTHSEYVILIAFPQLQCVC